MRYRLFSIIILVLFLPVVMAETFDIPGCITTARLGVNSKNNINMISDDCNKVTERTYLCGCKSGTVTLFSEDRDTEFDLIFQYSDAGVEKIKRFDNVKFQKQYFSEISMNVILIIFISLGTIVLVPLIVFFIVAKKNKKNERD